MISSLDSTLANFGMGLVPRSKKNRHINYSDDGTTGSDACGRGFDSREKPMDWTHYNCFARSRPFQQSSRILSD
jgi:hypothetical protein